MSLKEKALNGIWNAYSDNMPKFTMHSTIAGWILAVASNVFGVSIDKKIDKKEKKYLIPREIGDGAANILLFLCITKPMTWIANQLVENKKIVSKTMNEENKNILKSGLGVGASLLGAIIVSNILAPVIRNTFAAKSQKKFLNDQNSSPEKNPAAVINPVQNNMRPIPHMQTFLTEIRSGSLRI